MTDNCGDWMAAAGSDGESAEELHARASGVEFDPQRPLDAHVRLG